MNPEKRPSNIGMAVFGFAALAAAGYFSWAAVNGEFGQMQREQVTADVAEAEQQLASLTRQRKELENKVRRLSDDFLDLDLLDERVRDILGYARGDEIVIQ